MRKWMLGTAAVSLIGLVGCNRDKVTTYEVPKETPPAPAKAAPASAQNPHTGMDPHAGMALSQQPSVHWRSVPDGWTESSQSSAMRLATFTIGGAGNESAEMAIIPMGGFAGTDEQLVNMWRSQLGLPELSGTAAEGLENDVEIGGGQGKLYEMAGTANNVPTRIIVASANRGGMNFFFKLIGNDKLVADQKEAFLGFLKGVEFTAGEPVGMPPAMTAGAAPAGETRWQAPANWQELPATQFLLAKYHVPGEAGASADVNVSMLAGDGGGTLANVNRWRRQLGLSPVDEAGLNTCTSEVKLGDKNGIEVVLEGTNVRSGEPAKMLGLIIPLASETWFFKMTGTADVVDGHKEELLGFVSGARL